MSSAATSRLGSLPPPPPTCGASRALIDELHRSGHFGNVLTMCAADGETAEYVRIVAAGRSVIIAMYHGLTGSLSAADLATALKASIAYPRPESTKVSIEQFVAKIDPRIATMTGEQASGVLLALAAFWQGKHIPAKACDETRTKARTVFGDQVVETATLLRFAFETLTDAHISVEAK